jgi:hypothetical protein
MSQTRRLAAISRLCGVVLTKMLDQLAGVTRLPPSGAEPQHGHSIAVPHLFARPSATLSARDPQRACRPQHGHCTAKSAADWRITSTLRYASAAS